MTNDQAVTKAIEAEQVLKNEAYKAAIQSLKDEIVEQWKTCPVRDKEGQLLLLQLAKLADKFDAILKGYIESGKLAQSRIEFDELRDESRVNRFIRKVA